MNKELRLKILEAFGTQSDFAAKIGKHESMVSRVVRGRKALSKEDARVWSEALGCDRSILEPSK